MCFFLAPLQRPVVTVSLLQCSSVELWKLYLKFLTDSFHGDPSARQDIINAFEMALSLVGYDITSTPIWQGMYAFFIFSLLPDYIKFLKSYHVSNKVEDSQRMEAVRRLYQRAVVNPMNNLEGKHDQFQS